MSDSRGVGRMGEHGKENRKRRQKSEPGCGSSNGWQIASSSRCLVCGRLGSMCGCNKTRIDPQVKRQKLDNFLLSTPYVRCKQLKALDDISHEEFKCRRRVVDKWGDELKLVANMALTQRRLLLLAFQETKEREVLMATERKEWSEGMSSADLHVVLLAVARREREERLQLHTSAQREEQKLMAWHSVNVNFLILQGRESSFRDALANHEAAARAALRSHSVSMLNVMDNNEKDRSNVYKKFSELREQIVVEWRGSMEEIQNAIAVDRRRIEWMIQERIRFYELCVKQKMELNKEEEGNRQSLYDFAVKRGHAVMEGVQLHEQERCALTQEELNTRSLIWQDEVDACTALWYAFKQGEKEAQDVEQMKYERRETELRAAIHQLRSIAEEEASAFAVLKAQEHHERDKRYQWMVEKENEIQKMEQQAHHHMCLVVEEEALACQVIMRAMQEAEVEIAAWIQHKMRMLRELVDTACEQKGEIRLQEHEERFALVSQKAAHEDIVRRWMDQKESVRQTLITEEKTYRENGIEMERAAREELTWRLAEGLDNCQVLLQDRINKQKIFQQKALQALNDIVEQEAKAMLLITRVIQDDMERAFYDEQHRQVLDMLNTETEFRAYIVQKEVRHRESISTQMHLQKSFFAKEAQELLKARICEVMATEESQRQLLLHFWKEAVERLDFDCRQSFENAKGRESDRVREELHQRQMSLLEDERLYREDEMPIFSDHADNNTSHEPHDFSSDASLMPLHDTWSVQRQFVLTQLGGDENDVVGLPLASVEFLSRVIDAISGREASLTAALQQATTAVNETRRKVAKQRQLLSDVKERHEESKGKLDRDAAEHEARIIMHREARQRDEMQIERERERLNAKIEELRKMKNTVSDMRDTIHSQYRKR